MTTDQLYSELNYVDHSRANRLKYANLIRSQPELIPLLLNILFMVDDKILCRAAWVIESVCGAQLDAMTPHVDQFTEKIHNVFLDSAVRPVAKICEYLIKAFYSKYPNPVQENLLLVHRNRITEVCFDWMINNHKIASKAYAMESLFLLGQEFNWIHPELALILECDYQIQTSGFKSRARHILRKIKKA